MKEYLARNLLAEVCAVKLVLSRNVVYTGTCTLTLIYLSVKSRLLMKNVILAIVQFEFAITAE